MVRISLFTALLCSMLIVSTSCVKQPGTYSYSEGQKVEPEFLKKGEWKKVFEISGTETQHSKYFTLGKGEKKLIYKVHPTDQDPSTYKHFQIYLAKGPEFTFVHPMVDVFNKGQYGVVDVNAMSDKYYLYIMATEMNYEIEVYEKVEG